MYVYVDITSLKITDYSAFFYHHPNLLISTLELIAVGEKKHASIFPDRENFRRVFCDTQYLKASIIGSTVCLLLQAAQDFNSGHSN